VLGERVDVVAGRRQGGTGELVNPTLDRPSQRTAALGDAVPVEEASRGE